MEYVYLVRWDGDPEELRRQLAAVAGGELRKVPGAHAGEAIRGLTAPLTARARVNEAGRGDP